MKRRHRKDSNQDPILKALSKLPGVTVCVLSRPVDLCIGYKGRNYLIDIKNPETSHGLTVAQTQFFRDWRGQVDTAESLDDVLGIIGAE